VGMTQSDDLRYVEGLIARLRAWWRKRRSHQVDDIRTEDQSSE
jgi:hypothetical protein